MTPFLIVYVHLHLSQEVQQVLLLAPIAIIEKQLIVAMEVFGQEVTAVNVEGKIRLGWRAVSIDLTMMYEAGEPRQEVSYSQRQTVLTAAAITIIDQEADFQSRIKGDVGRYGKQMIVYDLSQLVLSVQMDQDVREVFTVAAAKSHIPDKITKTASSTLVILARIPLTDSTIVTK